MALQVEEDPNQHSKRSSISALLHVNKSVQLTTSKSDLTQTDVLVQDLCNCKHGRPKQGWACIAQRGLMHQS